MLLDSLLQELTKSKYFKNPLFNLQLQKEKRKATCQNDSTWTNPWTNPWTWINYQTVYNQIYMFSYIQWLSVLKKSTLHRTVHHWNYVAIMCHYTIINQQQNFNNYFRGSGFKLGVCTLKDGANLWEANTSLLTE